MCRVMIAKRENIKKYHKEHNLIKLLRHLEKEFGGHGNGYALIRNRKVIEVKKGVKVTVESCAEALLTRSYDYAIFHTRIASIGDITDGNCHPFVRGDSVLAMNGTESWLKGLASLNGITDAEVILDTIHRTKKPLDKIIDWFLEETTSVFVGAVDGAPFVVNAGGSLATYAGIYASSFPKKIPAKILDEGYATGNLKNWVDCVEEPVYQWYKTPSAKLSGYSYSKSYYPEWEYDFYEDTDGGYDEGYEEGYATGYQEGFQAGQKAQLIY